MQTTDFLTAVLPQEGNGYYCAVELKIKKSKAEDKDGNEYDKEELIPRTHSFFESIEDVEKETRGFSERGYEAYFALASFTTRANRTAANSAFIKALFLDIDAGGRNYPDTESALAAVRAWVVDIGFPAPYLVASGYGVHAYFPLESSVPISAWKPVAEALKRACAGKGLVIDNTVTADAARVLRCPGTKNRKHDGIRDVAVISVGEEPHPLEYFEGLLADWKEAPAPLAKVKTFDAVLDAAPAFARGKSAVKLFEDTQHSFERILEMGDKGCLQIQNYIRTASAEGSEPLFRAVMSIAKFCENGEQHALDLGALHPYGESRILRKFEEIGGPQKCATFNTGFPGVCTACNQWGKITTPIVLGRELRPQRDIVLVQAQREIPERQARSDADGTTEVVFQGEAEYAATGAHPGGGNIHTGPVAHRLPEPPDGFSLSERGVFGIKYVEDGPALLVHAADTPFYATATYDRLGERLIQFTYVEHGIVKNAMLPLVSLTGKDDAIKAFSRIGVVVPTNGEVYFRLYVKATIAEAKKNPVITMPTNLGWQKDDSFVFNNRVYSKHGETEVPMHGFDNINKTIGPRGTLHNWCLVVAAIMRLQRWDVVSMLAIGFAAPLMRFTGLNGVTFHLCGNNSGMGKTASQRLASSVWGHPDEFRITPSTSPTAMVNRLGMLGSLPLCVDEITHIGRKEVEWFPEFLSQMSDGRGKERMESQTNSERVNTTQWSSLALMTSNRTMMDYLTAERAHGSEGEIRRLIEIPFVKELQLDSVAKMHLLENLPKNCGVAGEKYSRWLADNVELAADIVKNTYNELFNAFEARGDERFWIAGCATIVAGVRIASSKYADIVEIPVAKVIGYMYEVVKDMRMQAGRAKRTPTDVLNEFTKRNFGKIVVVSERAMRIAGVDVAEVLDRRDLCARVEKLNGYVNYYIEERELRAFCSSLSFGYAEFKAGLNKQTKVHHLQKNLLSGAKGPPMPVKCIYVSINENNANKDIFFDEDGNEIDEQATGT